MNAAVFRKFEVHCTIDDSDAVGVKHFEAQCKVEGIKVIHVDNGATRISRHVMTSTVCNSRFTADTLLQKIGHIARGCNTPVIRNKIEVSPEPGDVVTGEEYFELHANIRCDNINEVPFDREKWYVSQNANKPVKDGKGLFMLTARGYNIGLDEFRAGCVESLESFKHLLDAEEHQFVEKCVFDDNVELDAHWMMPGV